MLLPRLVVRSFTPTRSIVSSSACLPSRRALACLPRSRRTIRHSLSLQCHSQHQIASPFSTSSLNHAQSPTADALMEHLTELYSTAKDEFEIAAEETEKKTVYAADDREAAADALKMLKEGYDRALKETSPEVSREIQSRVGQRIRELENAVQAMEQMAMED